MKFLVIWPDATHWPTHPSNEPPTHTHPWVGVSLQIINCQTELNYLDSVNISNFSKSFDLTPHFNSPTHPLTHQTIHPPKGGKGSTDFKSSNRIEISRLVQVLLNFYWFWGSPQGVGVGGWEWGWWEGAPHTCAHACTCMHMHACTHAYGIIQNSQGFPQWGQWPFAWNYHVYQACMCVRVHACMCVCVHMCGAPPQPPPPYQPAAQIT